MQCIYCRGNEARIEDVFKGLVKIVCQNPDCGKAIIYTMDDAKKHFEKEKEVGNDKE